MNVIRRIPLGHYVVIDKGNVHNVANILYTQYTSIQTSFLESVKEYVDEDKKAYVARYGEGYRVIPTPYGYKLYRVIGEL